LIFILKTRLYGNTCDWEKNAIRRLIADGRIAARLKGKESPDPASGATEECPICFLMYSEVNTTTCCHANMCTECYLQVRPQKEKDPTCPFCNCEGYSVVCKKKNSDIPSVCHSETASSYSDSSGDVSGSSKVNSKKKSPASAAPHTPKAKAKTTGFGSELEKGERFKKLKERSESFASSDGTCTPKKEQDIIHSIAMSEDDRKKLEEEMKAQHNHPLVLQLEAEAQERRLENDRAYQSSNSSSWRSHHSNGSSTSRNQHISRRARATRNWDQLARFLDQGEEDDDIAALETAILFTRMAEEVQTEASDGNRTAGNRNDSDRELEGFAMLRSLLTGQLDSNNERVSSGRSLSMRSGRRQRNLMRSSFGSLSLRHRGMGDVAIDTASMMMHGISEEEQISMAIAASMQDQEHAQSDEEDDNESNGSIGTGVTSSTTEDNNNSDQSADDTVDPSEFSPSEVAENGRQQLKREGNADEASTITELARVVTDTNAPNGESILNRVTA